MFRRCALLAAAAAWAAVAAAQAPPSMERIQPQLVANFIRDQAAVRDFEYREHDIVVKNGVRDARTFHVWFVRGHPIEETVALDDRRLSPAELAAEHDRALARAAAALDRPVAPIGVVEFDRRDYAFAKIAGDFLYAAPQLRAWNDRATWVYPARPNPGAPDRGAAEKALLSADGEIWVDAQDLHVVRVVLQSFKRFQYFFGLLFTIHQAHVELDLQREAPGLWLPAQTDMAFHATVLEVRDVRQSKRQTFSGYLRTHAPEPVTGLLP